MNVLKVLVLFVTTFSFQSTIIAQQPKLEVEGKAKITEMDEVSTSEKVVVRLPDGTLAELPIANLDGECNAFGDGSAGDVTLDETTDWAYFPPTDLNFMFKNLIIESGVFLFVSSGTIIMVQDTFINDGVIIVDPGIPGSTSSSHPNGEIKDTPGYSRMHRRGITPRNMRSVLNPGPIAGSNGADGSAPDSIIVSGHGGGTLVIRAGKSLVNNFQMNASGGRGAKLDTTMSAAAGSGGGGGGFLILISNGDIENNSVIFARGGAGGTPGNGEVDHEGGGGGGGLIHLISPNANTVGGFLEVQGGTVNDINSGNSGHNGGNGGGSIGDGGFRGSETNGGVPMPGGPGVVLRTQVSDVCPLIN